MKEYPWGKGTPKIVQDTAANDSSKLFAVPAGKIWRVKSVYGQLLSTATVGNRVLIIEVNDGAGGVVWVLRSANVPASTKATALLDAGSMTYGTTVAACPLLDSLNPGIAVYNHLPIDVLPAGYTIKVWDAAAIDAAADDLTVVLHYVEYDA